MTKKIFNYCFLVGALALLLCAAVFFGLQYRLIMDDAYDTLKQESRLIAHGLEQSWIDYFENL